MDYSDLEVDLIRSLTDICKDQRLQLDAQADYIQTLEADNAEQNELLEESFSGWQETSEAGILLLEVIDELAASNPFGFAVVYPDFGTVDILADCHLRRR